MHAKELAQKIGRETLPPVLVFVQGTAPGQRDASYEPVIAERLIEQIVANVLDPSMHDFAYSVFYADETPIDQILMEAQTVPFLVERRVIVLRGAERYLQMSGERKSPLFPLLEYLKQPADTTLLLMTCAGSLDKRKKFYVACTDAGALVECPQLTDAELDRWVKQELADRSKSIAPEALAELIGRTKPRLSDVSNALTLVTTYVGERDRILPEDVTAACADVAEESIWDLTNAIADSSPEKALRCLRQLLDFGKSHDEILGTINWLLETAYRASPETSVSVKSSFAAKKVEGIVKKLRLARIREALAMCTRTNFALRSTGVDKDLSLELLVIKLAAPTRRPARAR